MEIKSEYLNFEEILKDENKCGTKRRFKVSLHTITELKMDSLSKCYG